MEWTSSVDHGIDAKFVSLRLVFNSLFELFFPRVEILVANFGVFDL